MYSMSSDSITALTFHDNNSNNSKSTTIHNSASTVIH